jgi:hypothetical protein
LILLALPISTPRFVVTFLNEFCEYMRLPGFSLINGHPPRKLPPGMVIHVYINGNVALNCILGFLVKTTLKPFTDLCLQAFFCPFYGYGFVALKE